MRIAVVSLDTRGGIQPYAALSLGLQEAGHDVRLMAPENFAESLRARGLEVGPLPGSAEADVRASAGVAEMSPMARTRFMREHTAAGVTASTGALLVGAQGSDVITGGVGGMIVGLPVAEKLGVPFIEAQLQPLGPATAAFPGVLLPHVPRWTGALGRTVSHRLSAAALRLPFAPATRQVRTEVLGLPARPAPRTPMPSVYGYSPHVVPPAPEWGPDRHVTGYWMLPAQEGWTPPAPLADFLAAGPPPVCIGFGSMAGSDPEGLTRIVVDAVRAAGTRAVLLSGWGGLAQAVDAVDEVVVLDEVPHDWLFPRCAAVVHHGGAGTTGAGLAAGVPAVVVPFGVDQPFWGGRVQALGVGPEPVPRKRLTAENLAEALRRTLTDDAMRERARDLGEKIRAEDGVARAVEVYDTATARTR